MTSITDIVVEDARWQTASLDDLAERASIETLTYLGLPIDGYEVAVLACDDDRITVLNTEFRDKPGPTNVLSWPAEDLAAAQDGSPPLPPPEPDPIMSTSLGDIAISYDTCLKEAQAAQKPFADHVTHLVVHGVLHLLGYDHVRDGDATLMERLETEILGKLGVPNPY